MKIVTSDSGRFLRFGIAKSASKITELSLVGFFLLVSDNIEGKELFALVAVTISSLLDFFLQKMWSFRCIKKRPKHMVRDLLFYVLIRAGNFLFGLRLWYVLQDTVGMGKIPATIIVVSIYVSVSFCLQRLLFVGSIKDLFTKIIHK